MIYFHKTAQAPAKVNFYLNITGVRSDGYHDLDTLMHKIELSDEITLTLKKHELSDAQLPSQVSLSLSGYPIPNTGINTAQKAVEIFWAHIGKKEDCAKIHIEKHIPDQAGLGGGSSDAATILSLMNEAYGNRVSSDDLHQLATSIGADVPFFLGTSASICTGIGEVIKPVSAYSGVPILIIKPRQGVSTAEAYARIDERGDKQNGSNKNTQKDLDLSSDEDKLSGIERIKKNQHEWTNDFQSFALEKVPILNDIQDFMLHHGAFFSALTGSGSAWFGCFDNFEACQDAYQQARDIFVKQNCFICKAKTLSE